MRLVPENRMATEKHVHPDAHIVPTTTAEMIQYIGVRDLTEEERLALEAVVLSYHEKVKRKARNATSLTIHIKAHGTPVDGGKDNDKQRKYSLHVKLISPSRTLEASSADYDIRRMTHMALTALLNEIEHHFHDESGVAHKMMHPESTSLGRFHQHTEKTDKGNEP
jgi:hypothetical protein